MKNGKLNREGNRPTIIYQSGTMEWHNEDGLLHRDNGPAVLGPNGGEYYYLNGVEISHEDWLKQRKKINKS